MPGGRPPKPTSVKRREGNLGKRKLPKHQEQIRIGTEGTDADWSAPEHLNDDGRTHWELLIPELRAGRVAETVDRPALELLCLQWQLVCIARKRLTRDGTLARGSKGQYVSHPAVAMLNNASAMYLRLCTEFGMTASARARLDAFDNLGRDPGQEMAAALGPRLRVVS